MYAFIAANFIYIAAVDMLPLIIKETRSVLVIFQFLLMALGVGIMFVILEIEGALHH